MNNLFRQENKDDYTAVSNVIQRAFEKEEMSDHSEQYLVERLRNSEAFIPEL
ncbi:N-acetyltransferase, partial [Elizabethkingia miricola]|nr:N-acetyltransferase [Elizabethkingia miricola]